MMVNAEVFIALGVCVAVTGVIYILQNRKKQYKQLEKDNETSKHEEVKQKHVENIEINSEKPIENENSIEKLVDNICEINNNEVKKLDFDDEHLQSLPLIPLRPASVVSNVDNVDSHQLVQETKKEEANVLNEVVEEAKIESNNMSQLNKDTIMVQTDELKRVEEAVEETKSLLVSSLEKDLQEAEVQKKEESNVVQKEVKDVDSSFETLSKIIEDIGKDQLSFVNESVDLESKQEANNDIETKLQINNAQLQLEEPKSEDRGENEKLNDNLKNVVNSLIVVEDNVAVKPVVENKTADKFVAIAEQIPQENVVEQVVENKSAEQFVVVAEQKPEVASEPIVNVEPVAENKSEQKPQEIVIEEHKPEVASEPLVNFEPVVENKSADQFVVVEEQKPQEVVVVEEPKPQEVVVVEEPKQQEVVVVEEQKPQEVVVVEEQKPEVSSEPNVFIIEPVVENKSVDQFVVVDEQNVKEKSQDLSFSQKIEDELKDSGFGKINLTIFYDSNKSVLNVKVHSAENLVNVDKNSLSDPYARLTLEPDNSKETKRKTSVIKNSLNPLWEQEFEWTMTKAEVETKTLEINLKDEKSILQKQDSVFLGRLSIDLKKSDIYSQPLTRSYWLQHEHHLATLLSKK